MNWVMQNSSFIGQLFLNHTVLIVPPLIVAFICAVLVGALGAQYPRVQEIIGGACQLLYTIPSLPLLVITPIFLGVSITSPVTVMVWRYLFEPVSTHLPRWITLIFSRQKP